MNCAYILIGRVFSKATTHTSPGLSFKPTATQQPLRPDEVLFRSKNAPTRYEESDYYFAHLKLSSDQKLPSGELLGALHAYISNFYAKSHVQVDSKVFKSMDETALIALGILMEETAKSELGETGDFAFVEGTPLGEESSSDTGAARRSGGSRSSEDESEDR